MHVSFLDESRNPLSNRHSSFHVILVSSIRYYLLVDENSQAQGSRRPLFSETENAKFLTARCLWPRTWAERVSRLRSRTGRSPWSFSSLNLCRSYNQLATSGQQLKYFIRLVPIGFAYTGENGARGARDIEGSEPDWH